MSTFVKRKRIVDRELLDSVSELPCLVCKKAGPSDPDHIKTRGAGGGDTKSNVWPLCRQHHTERHTIGLNRFMLKYSITLTWIKDNKC